MVRTLLASLRALNVNLSFSTSIISSLPTLDTNESTLETALKENGFTSIRKEAIEEEDEEEDDEEEEDDDAISDSIEPELQHCPKYTHFTSNHFTSNHFTSLLDLP